VIRTVTVCTDRSPAGLRALKWAASEARRRALPLQVVTPEPRRRGMRSSVADALAAVGAAAPGLPVLGRTTRRPLPESLRRLSAGAATLVVPATLADVTAVVANSYCPVVAVPASDPTREAEHGPVVLGAAPWTADRVLGLAFQEASDRNAPLRVVRVWSEPSIDLGWLRPDRATRWDCAEERARLELEMALSAWTVIHPDVPVEMMVVQDHAADFLVTLSYSARLLVLGRSARGVLLSSIAGSPVDVLLRNAHSPVLVVPSEGPPRTTWLPSRNRARALAN
jgi:nucleotide-binding universal stress UspA family protein